MEHVNNLGGAPLGGGEADQAAAARWVDRIVAWDGNLFLAANADPTAAGVLGRLSAFKRKFAEARAAEHPELADTYATKIQSMAAADASAGDAPAVAANEATLVSLLDDAEAALAAGGPWLAGAYSVADVAFTPLLFRLGMAGKTSDYLKPRPGVSRYYDAAKERPSFAQAFGPAGSKLTLASSLLPALLKAQLAAWTGRY
ncbi:hypothetical protein HT031_003657 [Scenedesmus sp. PABB004]|nr:hypothetical protein HT031_003657 [Scenedesmus sp. PABB004]